MSLDPDEAEVRRIVGLIIKMSPARKLRLAADLLENCADADKHLVAHLVHQITTRASNEVRDWTLKRT